MGDRQRLRGWLTPTHAVQAVLVVVGLLLVAIALAAVFGAWDRTAATTTSARSKVVVATQATASTTKTTTTHATKSSSAPRSPSDSVIGSLLGAGLILFLTGCLLPRVTGITLPGGAGITLAEQAKVAATLHSRDDPRLHEPGGFERALIRALQYYAAMSETVAPSRVRPVRRVGPFRSLEFGYVVQRDVLPMEHAEDLAGRAVDLALADQR